MVLLMARYKSLRAGSFMCRKLRLLLRYESECKSELKARANPMDARILTGGLCGSQGECDSNISPLQIPVAWLTVDLCL